MIHFHPIFVTLFEILVLVGGVIFIASLIKKSKVDGNAQVAAHTGDSETLTFNLNLPSNLTTEQKQAKVFEAFSIVMARRQANHEAMEEIREASFQENLRRLEEAEKAKSDPLLRVAPPSEGN